MLKLTTSMKFSTNDNTEGGALAEGASRIVWKNSKILATYQGREITIWNLPEVPRNLEGEQRNESITPETFKLEKYSSEVVSLQFSNNNNIMFACFADNYLRVINVELLTIIREFKPYADDNLLEVFPFRNLRASPESSLNLKDLFITVSANQWLKVWDLSEWNKEKSSKKNI